MQTLLQSTASQIVFIYMVDLTDGYSVEVAAAVIPGGVYPTCYLTKNGGTPAALTLDANNFVELDGTNMGGWYKLILSAANTDTVGPLGIDVIKSTVTRHFATVVNVSAATLATVKVDTAAILADTGTDGVVVPTATQAALVDAVLDEVNTSGAHNVTNSLGAQLRAMTSASDPWAVDLPGSYVAGQAGYEIGRVIQGAGAGLGTITCQDEDDLPMEGCRCDVYTSATVVDAAHFWTGGMTNIAGVFTFYAPVGAGYWIRRFKRGYGFASDPVQITVS